MKGQITVGSRTSRLALVQAESVITELKVLNPHLEFNLVKITTRGDRHIQVSSDEIEGRLKRYEEGVFVKELEEALLRGEIDIAVHSLKDMPTEIPSGLSLAAVTRRLDPRDVLVSRLGKFAELPPGSRIGTGSQRRSAQIAACRSDIEVCALRGNIDTRLRKVSSGELDGVILAAAAMIRLNMQSMVTEYLDPEYFVPSVGQGALGIEIRVEDSVTSEMVLPLNHESTWQSVIAERTFLKAMGGGCRTPIAAQGEVKGDTLRLWGMVSGIRSNNALYATEEGIALIPEEVGNRLAQRMMRMGASGLIAEVGM